MKTTLNAAGTRTIVIAETTREAKLLRQLFTLTCEEMHLVVDGREATRWQMSLDTEFPSQDDSGRFVALGLPIFADRDSTGDLRDSQELPLRLWVNVMDAGNDDTVFEISVRS